MRMQEDGKLVSPETLTKREQITQRMIKYSPKRSQIAPGGKQNIRVLVRRPPNLPEGEYMLYMKILPSVQPVEAPPTPEGQTAVKMQMKTVVGMSCPIIVYQGNPTSTTTIADATLMPESELGKPAVKLFLDRTGKKSSYVSASIYSTAGGEKKLVGTLRRIPIFMPLKRRTRLIGISDPTFTGGPVIIELKDVTDPNKGVIDSKEMTL